MGLDVVAEGVESTTQLDALRRLGCGRAQGFLLGRPGSADAVLDLAGLELAQTQREEATARPAPA